MVTYEEQLIFYIIKMQIQTTPSIELLKNGKKKLYELPIYR